jgi:hypothetical protein
MLKNHAFARAVSGRVLEGPGFDAVAPLFAAAITSGLLKTTGPNLFGPYFSVSSLIIKQFGR